MKSSLENPLLALPIVLLCTAAATAEPTERIRTLISRADATHWRIDWLGETSYTYFPQFSPGHDLQSWVYAPLPAYLSGAGAKTFTFSDDPLVAPKSFYRLKYTDLDPANLAGDGIPALFKINTLGIDPFVRDGTDAAPANGLPDAWERYYFGGIGIASPSAVLQPDGLTNKQKSDLGLDPNKDYSPATTTAAAQYTYDLTGRLTKVTAPSAAATYTSDEEGNLTNAQ